MANEICAMWKQKAAQVIPIAIPSTGVIPKSLSQSLTTLNLHPNTYTQLQISVILGTCTIERNFLNYKVQVRPPSLILLITASQDRWIFPSQSWEVRNLKIILIIIIIISHELGLDGPVSASSNSLFKVLPSRIRPFSLQFSIIFGNPILLILVICRSHLETSCNLLYIYIYMS